MPRLSPLSLLFLLSLACGDKEGGAAADGSAHIELWAEGPAQLELGGRSQPVSLPPRRWQDLQIQGESARLELGAATITPP